MRYFQINQNKISLLESGHSSMATDGKMKLGLNVYRVLYIERGKICQTVQFQKYFRRMACFQSYLVGIITHNPPVVRAKITLPTRGLKSIT